MCKETRENGQRKLKTTQLYKKFDVNQDKSPPTPIKTSPTPIVATLSHPNVFNTCRGTSNTCNNI